MGEREKRLYLKAKEEMTNVFSQAAKPWTWQFVRIEFELGPPNSLFLFFLCPVSHTTVDNRQHIDKCHGFLLITS